MNNKTLIENLRCIPDFPKKGINFRDVTTLYKNAECVQIMLDELEAYYKDRWNRESRIYHGIGSGRKNEVRHRHGKKTRQIASNSYQGILLKRIRRRYHRDAHRFNRRKRRCVNP